MQALLGEEEVWMKKKVVAWLIFVGVLLCGCGNLAEGEQLRETEESNIKGELARGRSGNTGDSGIVGQEGTDGDTVQSKKDGDSAEVPEEVMDTRAVQGGPYGEIYVTLPVGWSYEAYPIDSDDLMSGMYGIQFHPEDVEEGYISLVYTDFFGVCGTGLSLEHTQIAGQPVSIGTYDNHSYWDYVSFGEEYEGIIALTYRVEDWWSEYGEQALEILDSLSFARDEREGGASIASEESDIDSLALHVSLKDITPTGATFVFLQYDTKASKGELFYGDDFVIERREGDKWERNPIVVEGDYGFHDIAYTLTPDAPDEHGYVTGRATAEMVIDWEWLYGKLSPGEYRIGKSVLDFVESREFDKYMVYAHFFLAEGSNRD